MKAYEVTKSGKVYGCYIGQGTNSSTSAAVSIQTSTDKASPLTVATVDANRLNTTSGN